MNVFTLHGGVSMLGSNRFCKESANPPRIYLTLAYAKKFCS